ncbi:MAG: TlpA family protein disulfide reductase [Thermoanaerobaculia bacterium]|nr:TlpA family protein disulfide reductase [Thermoanaerobaculia bacterium]
MNWTTYRRSISRMSYVAALMTVVCGVLACSSSEEDRTPKSTDFQLVSLDGQTLGPSDYVGDVLMVDFWASWCGPCRIQHEVLTVLQQEYSERGVSFLAVNSGEPEHVARKFATEHPYAYPVLLDENSAVSDRLGVLGLPTLMILDRQGKVVFFEPGLRSPREIRELLARAGA